MAQFVPDPDGLSYDDLLDAIGYELAERYSGVEVVLLEEAARRTYRILDLERRAEESAAARQRWLLEEATTRAQALRELREIANREVAKLQAQGLAAAVINTAAREGVAAAAARLSIARRLPQTGRITGSAAQAVGALVFDLQSKLEAMNWRITRYPDDVFQQVMSAYSPRVILGAQTPLQAQRAAVEDFLIRGLPSIDYRKKDGSFHLRMPIGSYAEMVGRTSSQRAWQDAGVWRMQQSGINLVSIRVGLDACARCTPWSGKVLSTTGQTGTVTLPHATQAGMVTITIDGTLDDARAAGWGHPNDRCQVVSVLPGLSLPPVVEHNAAAEAERAEQREIERDIRKAKRQAAAAGDDITRRRAERRVKAKQAEMRDFISRTGRNRVSAREQLHFADGH